MPQPFTILSFCGGGIRGLLSSTILSQLSFPQSSDNIYADLLAGCSTGATIVSWLVNGVSPPQISDLYQTHAGDFYSRQATDPQAPSYSADLGLYGQRYMIEHPTLSPSPWASGSKVSDLAQKVLLTSFSIGGQAQQWLNPKTQLAGDDDSALGRVDVHEPRRPRRLPREGRQHDRHRGHRLA